MKQSTVQNIKSFLVHAALVLAMPLVIMHGWRLFVFPNFGILVPSYLAIMGLTMTLRLSCSIMPSVAPRDALKQIEHEERMEAQGGYCQAVKAAMILQAWNRLLGLGFVAGLMSIVARFQ